GVVLHADEPGMALQLHDLDEVELLVDAGHAQPRRLELRAVRVVVLVAVAVALVDEIGAVRAMRDASRLDSAGILAQALRSALAGHAPLTLDEVDDGRLARLVELARVGPREPEQLARREDRGALHAEADAEVRDAVLARPPRRGDLRLDAAVAVSAGNEDGVHAGEHLARVVHVNAVG